MKQEFKVITNIRRYEANKRGVPEAGDPAGKEELYVGLKDRKYQIWKRNSMSVGLIHDGFFRQMFEYACKSLSATLATGSPSFMKAGTSLIFCVIMK